MSLSPPVKINDDGSAVVFTTEQPGDNPDDIRLCQQVGQILWNEYPGWGWKVEVPPNQDIIIVRNLDLDPRGNWAFMIRKGKYAIEGRKIIVVSGGELLERWNASRTKPFEEEINGREMLFVKPEK